MSFRCHVPPCSSHCLSRPPRSAWDADQSVDTMSPLAAPHYCTRLQVPRRSLDFYYSTVPAEHGTISGHHALAVLASQRPITTQLPNTLNSLREAGAREWTGHKLLVTDGPLEHAAHDVEFSETEWQLCSMKKVGAARAYLLTMRLALAADPDLELLTIVEDDVELCRNALLYARQLVIPNNVSFVTWFTYPYDWSTPRHPQLPDALDPTKSEDYYTTPTLACRPARFFILTQMVTFTRLTIDRIFACPHATHDWPKLDGHDELVAWTLGDASYATHFPVLAQHRGGLDSAVVLARGPSDPQPGDAQEGARTSPYYVGPDFDALSLINP